MLQKLLVIILIVGALLYVLPEKANASFRLLQDHTGDYLYPLHNQYRKWRGIPELSVDQRLVIAACQRAEYLVSKNIFTHDGWQAFLPSGYSYYGENLAKGGTKFNVFQAWLNSPEHKANIVDVHFRHIGSCSRTRGNQVFIITLFAN